MKTASIISEKTLLSASISKALSSFATVSLVSLCISLALPACSSSSNNDKNNTPSDDQSTNPPPSDSDDMDESEDSDELSFKDLKVLIEHNASDEDTGFQAFVDGEPWNEITISGPGGEAILHAQAEGGLFDFGLTELFYETSEPENDEVSIENVLARLMEGDYILQGDPVEGDSNTISTPFTHDIPEGPELLTPEEDDEDVDPNNVVVSWEPVDESLDEEEIDIVGYQVIVEIDDDEEFPAGFAVTELSVYVPHTVNSVTIPPEFMESGECYKYEVLAIEESGNQSISEAEFATGGSCEDEDGDEEDEAPGLKDGKILIEHNATDGDTGFQGFGDGDPWNSLTVNDPNNVPIAIINAQGGLVNFGLTELFFETSEPENDEVPISDVLMRLPEGTYTFVADIVDAGQSTFTTEFTHDIPMGAVLISPEEGDDEVDPAATIIEWEPVTQDIDGDAITIVGYQVIVELDEDPESIHGFSEPKFSVYMPADATRVSVPPEFMLSDETYEVEVLAIEESGNQTISLVEFETE